MLKKKLLICTIFLSIMCNAETITLDKVLNLVDKNSSEKQIYELNNKIYESQESSLFLGEFNGINLSTSYSLDSIYNSDDYDKTLNAQLSFGPFFSSFNRNTKNNMNFDFISYGIKKNLKDFFVSKNRYELEKMKLNQKLNKINFDSSFNLKKDQIIDMYNNLVILKETYNVKKEALNTITTHNSILNKLYELGKLKKIDLDTNNLELESLKNDIEKIENNMYIINKIIFSEYGINLNDFELEPIKADIDYFKENLYKYNESQLKKSELELLLSENELNYSNLDSFLPDINISFVKTKPINDNAKNMNNYSENKFSISLQKQLFATNPSQQSSAINKEINLIKMENVKRELINEREKLKIELEEMSKKIDILSKKVDIEKNKYDIKNKEFEMNRISYVDLLKSYNEYLAAKIEKTSEEHKFNAYVYKNILRSNI